MGAAVAREAVAAQTKSRGTVLQQHLWISESQGRVYYYLSVY